MRALYNVSSIMATAAFARFRSAKRLERLRNCGDTVARRIADVLVRAKAGDLTESREWLQRIEAKRTELLQTDRVIPSGRVAKLCKASKKAKPATIMHLLIREFRPAHVLELGTNLGISAAYLASALKINGQGRVVTIELAPDRVDLARQLHTSLGLDNVSYVCGRFADTLGPVLDDLVSVELAFIDGHHQMQPTLDYFERISRHASSEALLVFDDIRWSPGMWRAWQSLRADARIRVGVDMLGYAICAGRQAPSAGQKCLVGPILC
jgi:predicted O-methyltransferase YrrM